MPYRHQIRILHDVAPDGTSDPDYEVLLSAVPCDLKPMGGGEVYRGLQIEATTTSIIETRYNPAITTQMIAENELTGKRYLISRILEQHGRQRVLLIQCTEPNNG